MIVALVIGYCIALYLVFIQFRWVKLNLGTAAISASAGAFGMMILGFSINYLQPWTTDTVVAQFTTPIQPRVTGRVIEVPVKNGAHCKKGDVLFKVDPQPYSDQLNQAQAGYDQADVQTAAAITADEQTLSAAKANVTALKANLQAIQVGLDFAQTRLKQYTELASKQAGSQFQVEQYQAEVDGKQQQLAAAKQQLIAADADMKKAKIALESALRTRDTTLAQLRAQADAARWSVEQATVRAPEDGYVTQLNLQVGAMASLTPVMVYLYDGAGTMVQTSWFQEYSSIIEPGLDAEVALPAYPGKVFKAKVDSVQQATGQGQLDPGGKLEKIFFPRKADRTIAYLTIAKEDLQGCSLLVGSAGQCIVKGKFKSPLFFFRRVQIRMYTWTNFLFIGY
jgi:multidrug resistance efflux pump